MAAPTIDILSSFEPLDQDEHISRWISSSSSSSSFSSSPSFSSSSISASSFTDADCYPMFKSLTGTQSMSSDTQTENETPLESPSFELQTTPVVVALPFEYPPRPALLNRVSIHSDIEHSSSSDAGYETECEDKHSCAPFEKRRATRRIPANRRRGEHHHRPAQDRLLSFTPSTLPVHEFPLNHRPSNIDLPPPSLPLTPSKAPIGLGLGLGLPSTLSAVHRAQNYTSHSSTNPPSTTQADLVTPFPLIPTPSKPRLAAALSSPSADGVMSPLALPSPAFPAPQLRHPAFSFPRNGGGHCGGTIAIAAIFTLATLSQSYLQPSRSSTSSLQSTPEEEPEVYKGDATNVIRRFASEGLNPYFPNTMGLRVISG